jgi:uncharacterized repeat protein (TIGR03803 family)
MTQLQSLGPITFLTGCFRNGCWATTIRRAQAACAVALLCAGTATVAAGQTFKSLLSLDGTDGAFPNAAPVPGANGNLYGTTVNGGANGVGTVFEITPAGKLTTLYTEDLCRSSS